MYPGVPKEIPLCTSKIELPIPGWASMADFLMAEIEEKEKKRVDG